MTLLMKWAARQFTSIQSLRRINWVIADLERVMVPTDLSKDIAAFQAEKARLMRDFGRQWVVFADAKFQAVFQGFPEAALYAVEKFGDRPFLIRRADDPQTVIPMMVVEEPI